MLKSKKFWTFESSQNFELKQEILDNYKIKGRVYEDFNYFYDLMGIGPHPCLKQPYGKEHTEPNVITFISHLVDINTLKILFTILPNTKIITLKFSSNYFEVNNLEFLINTLLTKPNNIYNFIFEWNNKIKIDGSIYSLNENENNNINNVNSDNIYSLSQRNLDQSITTNLLKCQQLICKLATSQKLEAICLRGNFIGDETAILLFENLRHNTNLKVLNLFKNNLTSKCMNSFNSMIEINRKLEEVNLGGNFFNDEDLNTFKNYVGKIPMTMEQVEMHNKKVKERDAIIEKNKKLKIQKKPEEHVPILDEISLIGDTYFIIKNTQLKNFNLMQNLFTEKCFEDLIYILEVNQDLLITMDGRIFGKVEKDKLIDPFGKYGNRVYLTK